MVALLTMALVVPLVMRSPRAPLPVMETPFTTNAVALMVPETSRATVGVWCRCRLSPPKLHMPPANFRSEYCFRRLNTCNRLINEMLWAVMLTIAKSDQLAAKALPDAASTKTVIATGLTSRPQMTPELSPNPSGDAIFSKGCVSRIPYPARTSPMHM